MDIAYEEVSCSFKTCWDAPLLNIKAFLKDNSMACESDDYFICRHDTMIQLSGGFIRTIQ
ncbi:MAG: hypothetical protein CL584_01905 [Alteromonadaceae bacterium]|nr:hypothetical protein [Alteromonadaceae bacterium]